MTLPRVERLLGHGVTLPHVERRPNPNPGRKDAAVTLPHVERRLCSDSPMWSASKRRLLGHGVTLPHVERRPNPNSNWKDAGAF